VKITWAPTSCPAVVQSYQQGHEKPVREYNADLPGKELEIGDPNSGETEIKIWGNAETNHSVWVWIEEPQKTEEPPKQPDKRTKRTGQGKKSG
jgi:hypothetical protein